MGYSKMQSNTISYVGGNNKGILILLFLTTREGNYFLTLVIFLQLQKMRLVLEKVFFLL